jgi:hypothetical protein
VMLMTGGPGSIGRPPHWHCSPGESVVRMAPVHLLPQYLADEPGPGVVVEPLDTSPRLERCRTRRASGPRLARSRPVLRAPVWGLVGPVGQEVTVGAISPAREPCSRPK